MRKITDFFLGGQNPPFFGDTNNLNINRTDDKRVSDKKNENLTTNEQNLSLFEYDEQNLILNNNQKIQNNQNSNKYKRKKMEEPNIIQINHKFNNPRFFINLQSQSNKNENRKLILLDLTENKTLKLQQLNIEQKHYIDPKEYNKAFPFQFSRIININDTAYITGGKLNDNISKLNYNNEVGEKKCYKLIFNEKKRDIEIDILSSSIFEHQSHSLLYLKKYNTIIMCSGHKQINCEYLNLDENKWKIFYPLQKPRENALSFVFNEKYIFLVGGKNQKGIINEDYDVIDFEIFLNNKVQNYWKTYTFLNKNVLERLDCGIIYKGNEIYILGGYNNKNEFCSWKMNFEIDINDNSTIFNDEKIDKLYRISSVDTCDKINNYFKKRKNINYLCYCGQQSFINFNEFLLNISLGGQLTIIPENEI